jgi:hypothetical protein
MQQQQRRGKTAARSAGVPSEPDVGTLIILIGTTELQSPAILCDLVRTHVAPPFEHVSTAVLYRSMKGRPVT